MKISKIAIAALFAAGFITASASAGFAEDEPKPQISIDCIEGYSAVYSEDGTSGSCEADAEVYVGEPTPIDSCWETEDGTNVCARGGTVPGTANGEEPTPIDSCWETEDGTNVCARGGTVPGTANGEEPMPIDAPDCMITTDADGNVARSCEEFVLYDTPADDGSLGGEDEGMGVDETLMFQSGVGKSGSDNSSSNALAAFGVLVGALGALGIGLSRQKDAK